MDIRRLDLNLLLLLDGLLATANLSTTARRLGISQPAASASLSKLRHFFQDDLFVRTGRGLRPTALAEELKAPVRSVIDLIDNEILKAPRFDPKSSERDFTLAMPDLGEIIFLPAIIARVRSSAPNVTLKCLNIGDADVGAALEEGVLDLALGYHPDLIGPSVQSEVLFEDPMVCIAREGHPKVRDDLTIEEFLDLEHLVVGNEGKQEAFARGSAHLDARRRKCLHIPHFMSIPRLVAATDLVSVVPLSLARSFDKQYGLRLFQPPVALTKVTLKQFWHRRMQNEPAVAWLRDLVSKNLVGRGPQHPA